MNHLHTILKVSIVRAILSFAVIALSAGFLVNCGKAPPAPVFPRYNQVYGIATHNSYWINRSDQADYESSGVQELLSDQLLHEHVRAIELDIHSTGSPNHDWKVYHTSNAEDFVCNSLSDCLQMLANFQYAEPQHDVINVIVELKNTVDTYGTYGFDTISAHNFDTSTHTIQDFDNLFVNILGKSHIYTPGDFLNDCSAALASRPTPTRMPTTMVDCAAQAGWPTIDKLRGKFIINILGNWGTAAEDWVTYAISDMHQRIAFPMESIFDIFDIQQESSPKRLDCRNKYLDSLLAQFDAPNCFIAHDSTVFAGTTNQYAINDIVSSQYYAPDMANNVRVQAHQASVFWQFEAGFTDLANQFASKFLSFNGVIRGSDSFDWNPLCPEIKIQANIGLCANHQTAGCKFDKVPDASYAHLGLPTYTIPQDNIGCQDERISAGFQLIQTNYPWHFINNDASSLGIPTDPSQRVYDPSWLTGTPPLPSSPYKEPGSRLYFSNPIGNPNNPYQAFLWSSVQRATWLETTVSTTRIGDTWINVPGGAPFDHGVNDELAGYPRTAREQGAGCLRADDGKDFSEGVLVCRLKTNQLNPDGTVRDDSEYQEQLYIGFYVIHNGRVTSHDLVDALGNKLNNHPQLYGTDRIGNMLAMRIDATRKTVTVYSAGRMAGNHPDWTQIGQYTFATPLTRYGLLATGDVLFVGTKQGSIQTDVGSVTQSNFPNKEVIGYPSVSVNIKDLSS